jgi:hypothetical protein
VEKGVVTFCGEDKVLVLNFGEYLLFGLFLEQLLLAEGFGDEEGQEEWKGLVERFEHNSGFFMI